MGSFFPQHFLSVDLNFSVSFYIVFIFICTFLKIFWLISFLQFYVSIFNLSRLKLVLYFLFLNVISQNSLFYFLFFFKNLNYFWFERLFKIKLSLCYSLFIFLKMSFFFF